jgi:hypothetical protein
VTVDDFERALVALIGRPTDLRPFVCEGSPSACDVFLVGCKPATTMRRDFWEFWRRGYGYDKVAWVQGIRRSSRSQSAEARRMRRQKVSATRRNVECFVEGAAGVRVLETNVHARASRDMRSLDPASREVAPFRFLLDTVMPKVVVVNCKPALEAMAALDTSVTVIATNHHFSRQTSRDTARQYGALAAGKSRVVG